MEETIILKDFTNEEFSKDLLKNVGKLNFREFVHQPVAAKIIIAVISRAPQTGGGKLEGKMCRMMRADLMSITSSKQGCAVVQAALQNFSRQSKVLLAEQLAEFGSVEDFTSLWTHGSNIFISMLDFMDESGLSTVHSPR